MMKPLHLLAACAACFCGWAGAQAPASTASTALTAPAARISDEAVHADQQAYQALQGRIKGLNDRGRPVRDYHLAKAQCWLDVSFHEYTRNDRSAFPQEALTESEKLIVGMENGASPLPNATPLVNGAARLRPDLWDRAALLRDDAHGWRCAQQKMACAEVELVHAGNEHNQQQWRHAKPYVQIAEDLIGEAEALAASCPRPAQPRAAAPEPAPVVPVPVALPAPPPPPAPVAAPEPPPPVADKPERVIANVVFHFDRHQARDMLPYSVTQLEMLATQLKADGVVLKSITLTGHADRLNGSGRRDYNQRLSERRVQTVRDALVKLGLPAALISTDARGDSEQVRGCEEAGGPQTGLTDCLLPNRRVEVKVVLQRTKP